MIIAAHARFVTEYRAWAACHIQLHGVCGVLSPAEKAGVRVRGSPYTYRAQTYERGEMHVGGIHREHRIAMAQQRQLGTNAERCRGNVDDVGEFPGKRGYLLLFLFSESENKYLCVRADGKMLSNLLYQFKRIDFTFVFCKRCDGKPVFTLFFGRRGISPQMIIQRLSI